jgi:hypothetical protein
MADTMQSSVSPEGLRDASQSELMATMARNKMRAAVASNKVHALYKQLQTIESTVRRHRVTGYSHRQSP